jgi:hypothetical protein
LDKRFYFFIIITDFSILERDLDTKSLRKIIGKLAFGKVYKVDICYEDEMS